MFVSGYCKRGEVNFKQKKKRKKKKQKQKIKSKQNKLFLSNTLRNFKWKI